MDRCDVLIVGAGPAGSSCARFLAQSSLDVVVMDRSAFPRDKVCAGWITPQVVATLGLDLEDYARRAVLQEVAAFRCGLMGELPRTIRYGTTVSYAIRRREFDQILLERSGARLRLSETLDSAVRCDHGWIVNGALQTRLLVGAGGHFCPVARLLGSQVGRAEGAVYAQEAEFPLTAEQAVACGTRGDTPELYFCQDLSGYGWCVRKGDYLNIGLGREDPSHLVGQLQDFWRWLQAAGRVPGIDTPHFKGHAYLQRRHAHRTIVTDNALLIGDSAGLAYDESGEGIRPAVESALLAAETIRAAEGDYRVARLAPYAIALDRRLGCAAAGSRTGSPTRRAVAKWLMRNRAFARHVLLDHFFLHRHQPPLRPLLRPSG
jgi:geranylgeranyl reductase family protein